MTTNTTPNFKTLGDALAEQFTGSEKANACIVYDTETRTFSRCSELSPRADTDYLLSKNMDVAEWGIECEADAHAYAAQPETQQLWRDMIRDYEA